MNHRTIQAFERGWLVFGLAMIAVFIVLIGYSVANNGNVIPQGMLHSDQGAALMKECDNPRVEQTADGYVVYSKAMAYSYMPSEMKVKAGVPVTFYITSPDVQHGFNIEGTNVNVQVLPGEVARVIYTFDKAGEYRIICNEYCGLGHQNMFGKVLVEDN